MHNWTRRLCDHLMSVCSIHFPKTTILMFYPRMMSINVDYLGWNTLWKPLLDDPSSRPAAWNWCSHPKLWPWCRCSQWPTFSHCCRRSGPGPRHRVLEMWPGTSSFSCPTLWPFYPSMTKRSTSNRSCKCSLIIRIDGRSTRIRDWEKRFF